MALVTHPWVLPRSSTLRSLRELACAARPPTAAPLAIQGRSARFATTKTAEEILKKANRQTTSNARH